MRIIDYYNYIAMAACIIIGAAAIIIYYKRSTDPYYVKKNYENPLDNPYVHRTILFVIMLIAAFLRLYKLGSIPYGLQADEASIGYEAYSLSYFGIDRNGYAYPVYPITFGCGGGSPLLIYLNAVSVWFFGTGVFKLRLIPAILGILTVFVFYLVLKETFSSDRFSYYRNVLTLCGTFFLAICPWHVILSRWSLDSNIMPFTLGLATYLFMRACRKKRTALFILSSIMYGICMYSYGSATIVVPLHLIIMSVYLLRTRNIRVSQLVASIVAFLIVFAPLLVFYCINYLGFPEIVTSFISFNKFTASRQEEVFLTFDSTILSQLWRNIKTLFKILTIGDDSDMLCHYVKGYATLFEFTFPITCIGIGIGAVEFFKGIFEKEKRRNYFAVAMSDSDVSEHQRMINNAVWFSLFVSAFIFSLLIKADISRMVMIFLPLCYFFVRGICFVFENEKKLYGVLVTIVLLASVSFAKDYFTGFNSTVISIYMPTYGDAVKRAYQVAGDERQIYSTYDGLSSPYIIALYYTNYDPRKFSSTVVYKDPYAEFRVAQSFGNFVFDDLPEDVLSEEYQDTVFVISAAEQALFDGAEGYTVEDFGGYKVVYQSAN
ncbi:ArnT family glycosyltransferase [Butyrivibrio proteoclasticus]|uniref:ArnT family glycosyltransferase n=1 Tax=Butyrivibrio proteoclasticus TaxID=43305 RepID=UPI00047961DE|nr:glycosyltransferase family 39 protein [Butyrivibrio proteoclasticus]